MLLPAVLAALAVLAVVAGFGRRPAEKPVLRIGYLPITHSALLALAHHQHGGAFGHFNLEVVKFGSWPELTEALFGGGIDGAVMLFELALAGRQRGIPLRAVALTHRDGNVMVVRPEIATVAQLAGRRVAIPSRFSVHHILLHKALAGAGVPYQEVEVVEMPPPYMMAALARGEVAAYLVAEPFGAIAEVRGVGRVLLQSQEVWENSTCCVLVLREEVMRIHPDAAAELVDALLAAGEAAEADPTRLIAISRQYFGHAENILGPGLARTTFRQLQPSIAEFARHQQLLLELGVLPRPLDLEELIDERLARRRP
jgi:NitT/TauT family transport system substrate-binding protein